MKRTGPEESLKCSFCHKAQDAVGKLISSPGDYPRSYICDECVTVCNSILEEDFLETSPARDGADGFFAAIFLKLAESEPRA